MSVFQQDEEAVRKLTATAGTKSKLAKPVQELIKMIFDVESMKKAMVEFEVRPVAAYTRERKLQFSCDNLLLRRKIIRHCRSCLQIDLQKMPLGKLSKRQIQSAYALLTEVHQVGNQPSGPG